MSNLRQPPNSDKKQIFEDPDLDSGFCSSTISGEQFLLSDEISSNDNNKNETSYSEKAQENSEKIDNCTMDSAYCDSGMVSAPIEQNFERLTIQPTPKIRFTGHDESAKNENEVYFQQNEDGDT